MIRLEHHVTPNINTWRSLSGNLIISFPKLVSCYLFYLIENSIHYFPLGNYIWIQIFSLMFKKTQKIPTFKLVINVKHMNALSIKSWEILTFNIHILLATRIQLRKSSEAKHWSVLVPWARRMYQAFGLYHISWMEGKLCRSTCINTNNLNSNWSQPSSTKKKKYLLFQISDTWIRNLCIPHNSQYSHVELKCLMWQVPK